MLRLLSLGAGRQSSYCFLASCVGALPKLDGAIFADTGDEPPAVYRYLEYLTQIGAKRGIPVHVTRRPGPTISEHLHERIPRKERLDNPPFFIRGDDGRESIISRDCTREWKVKQIERKTKELLGLKPRSRWPKECAVETWLGIAFDERNRMKVSTSAWQRFWHPCIEQPWSDGAARMRFDAMTTRDCVNWILDNGFEKPPRSACTFCPFHSNEQWRDLRDNDPESWEYACQVDEFIRTRKLRGMERDVYLHRSLVPLREAPIDDTRELPLFDQECAGVCGV